MLGTNNNTEIHKSVGHVTFESTMEVGAVLTMILDPLLRFGKELTIFVMSSVVTALPPLDVTFST